MKLAATLRNRSSLKTANSPTIRNFSLLLFLGLARFHGRKPIFRGALYSHESHHSPFFLLSHHLSSGQRPSK